MYGISCVLSALFKFDKLRKETGGEAADKRNKGGWKKPPSEGCSSGMSPLSSLEQLDVFPSDRCSGPDGMDSGYFGLCNFIRRGRDGNTCLGWPVAD